MRINRRSLYGTLFSSKEKCKKVQFTGEKKCILVAPDGWTYYYHDLRKEKKFFSKRRMGGDSVMIWAEIECIREQISNGF